MVQHYLQLLQHYRRVIVALVALTTLLTAAVSAFRLATSPLFTAAASVAVLPTEAEAQFGRETQAGPGAAARGLTETYIEYLKSRPVVEAAFKKIGATMTAQEKEAAAQGWLVGLAKGAVDFARKLYRTLDSGRYVPMDPREAALNRLMEAINLTKVEESYILRVEVSLPNPETAAAAANALAEAYVERASEQLAASVGQISGFLREQIELREEEMQALRAREEKLKAGVGSSSLDEERNSLVRVREVERGKLMDAQAQLDAAQAEVDSLQGQDPKLSGRSLVELAEARAQAAARRDAALKNVGQRQTGLRDLSATLEALKQKEEPLLSVQRRLAVVQEDLGQLNARRLTTDLTRSSALTQVRVIDPAVVPVYPSSPRVMQNTALGLIAGLLLGMMLLVFLDTVSGTIKTTADLERLVGRRSLGSLRRSSPTETTDLSWIRWPRLNVDLRALGAELERGLTMVNAFEAPAIQVTGFLCLQKLAETAALFGAALASEGRAVSWKLPANVPLTDNLTKIAGKNVAFTGESRVSGEERDTGSPRTIRVECLHPISADLSLSEAAGRSPALVCIVPAGEVSERSVKDFHDRALESGMSALAFLLVTA